MRTTKKILLTTASVLAASAFTAGAQAATPVAASTIINAGVTHATSTGANFIFDVATGTLTNNGIITNNGTGTAVTAATVQGNLINSGTIIATGVAVSLEEGGSITNNAAGRIIATGVAAQFRADSAAAAASLTNSGSILSNTVGVQVGSGVSFASGIINTGTIGASLTNGRALVLDATATSTATTAINNNAGGRIVASGTGGIAISVASDAAVGTITNAGDIVGGAGANARAIDASGATARTIVNTGTITAAVGAIETGSGNDSLTNTGSIIGNTNLAAGNNTVVNSGRITGGITTTTGNDSLTNNASGVITAAVNLGAGDNTIINSGNFGNSLTTTTGSDVLTNNAGASIVGAIDLGAGNNTITNSGTFGNSFTTAGGNDSLTNNSGAIITGAVNLGAGDNTITNSGTFSAGLTTTTGSDVLTNNAGASIVGAIDLGAGNNTITNSGTFGNSFTTAGGNDSLTNNSGAIITGAVNLGAGDNTIVNSGTFSAGLTTTTGSDVLTNNAGASIVGAIDLGEGNNTITTAGTLGNTLTGGTDIDILNLTGGTITGAVDLEGGADVMNISGTATTVAGISNIEDINHTAGTWHLNGAVTGATTGFDVSSGAILNLGANVTTNRLTNAGTMVLTASRTLTGQYTQSGTLDVDFNTNGNSEVLTIAGGANTAEFLTGSILQVNIASGVTTAAASNAAAYNVIAAAGAASGTANLTVASSNPLVNYTATNVGNNVQLSSARATSAQTSANALANNGITSDAQLQSLAGGGNGGTNASSALTGYGNLLGALDGAGNTAEFNRINTAFSGLTAAQTAEALEDLSGDAGVTSANSFAVSAGVNASNQVITAQLSDARTQMAKAPEGAAAGDAFGSDLRVWVQPFAGTFEQDRKQGVEGYESNTYGLAFGGDVSVSEMARAGVAFSYANTDVDGSGVNAANGSEIDGYNLSLYGTYTPITNLFIDAMVGYGYNSYDTDRFVAFLGQRAKADYNGNQYNFRLGAGYDIKADALIVTPGAYLTYARIEQDSFTETGAGGASLNVQDQEVDRGQAGLDLTIAYPVQIQEGLLKPRISAGYAREIGDENVSSSQSFTGGGAAFTTRGADLDENVGKFGLGVDLETTSGTVFTLDGEYETRSTADGFSGFARVKAPF